MFENMAGLVEVAFVYTVVLGFGLWQLISVRKLMRRDREEAERREAKGDAPPSRDA